MDYKYEEMNYDELFDLDDFDEVEVAYSTRKGDNVTVGKSAVYISKDLIRQLGWDEKTRLRLVQKGSIFALLNGKDSKGRIGILHINNLHGERSGASVCCADLCRKIVSLTGGIRDFKGTVQEGANGSMNLVCTPR